MIQTTTPSATYRVTTEWLPTLEIPDHQRDHVTRVITSRAAGITRAEQVTDATELLAMVGLIEEAGPAGDPLSIYPICGTPAGYELHLKEHTDTCEPCKAAKRQRSKAWTDAARAGRIELPPMTHHGYPGGPVAHRLRGQEPCDECAEASKARRNVNRALEAAPDLVGAR